MGMDIEADLDNLTVLSNLKSLVKGLESNFSWRLEDRDAAKRAARNLAELAKIDVVGSVVEAGAVAVLVKHLGGPPAAVGCERFMEFEVEKKCAYALGLLACKPEYQQLIVDEGALTPFIKLLKRHKTTPNSRAFIALLRVSADALTNLAYENSSIKTCIRIEGGIPPLVELLEHADPKVQKSAVHALWHLAYQNNENKNQITECNALPTLIFMLRSEDPSIHYKAVGTIRSLVCSSPKIEEKVLAEGALQPVIVLLSSPCTRSQAEAALLIGLFASDARRRIQIAQRGAVRPLVKILKCEDTELKAMATFALARLAQDTNNQAGIVHDGGLLPLLELLDSKNDGSLQSHAALALSGIATNEDNISDVITVGGFQMLQHGEFTAQATKDLVTVSLQQIEEKLNGPVLRHLLYLMRVGDRCVQSRIALALAHLCSPEDQKRIFLDNNGLDLLLSLLISSNAKQQQDGAVALYRLTEKVMALHPLDSPPSPMPQACIPEDLLNNPSPSNVVTFKVEGRTYSTYKIPLIASSDVFQKMLDGDYKEKEVQEIVIPNIPWEVFMSMMEFIHTGSVEVNSEIAQGLLRAADQYLLEGLKRSCEYVISKDIDIGNISTMYDLSETYNAVALKLNCILFILKNFSEINSGPAPGQSPFMQHIIPDIRIYFNKALQPNNQKRWGKGVVGLCTTTRRSDGSSSTFYIAEPR